MNRPPLHLTLAIKLCRAMKDRFFFPLALLLAAALVMIAMVPALGRLPTGAIGCSSVNYKQCVIEGVDLNRAVAGGDADLQLLNGNTRLRITAAAGALQDDPEQNPHFRLASDIEVQFSGFEVEVEIVASPAADAGAMDMQANYRAGRVGESGWIDFKLLPGLNSYSFNYNVPLTVSDERGFDYFAIRPAVPDKTRAIEIERITFTRLKRHTPQ